MTQTTPAPPPAPSLDRLREAAPYLSRWLATQVETRHVPGAQVAVRLGDELVLSAAFGVADEATGAELTTGHLFRVASHSKTFTAVAVLRLVAAGRLRLDDTVAERLPDCADTPLARVTVRELLSHTSGAIRDGVDADHWQLDGPFPDADALRAIVREHGATYAPQERFKYSNIGYAACSGRSSRQSRAAATPSTSRRTSSSRSASPTPAPRSTTTRRAGPSSATPGPTAAGVG